MPDKSLTTNKRRRGRKPRGERGSEFELAYQLQFKPEKFLWRKLEDWTHIYEQMERQSVTIPALTRRWLHLALKIMEAKVASGEIDPAQPLPPGKRLP